MITKIIDLLKEDKFYGVSNRVDTAKGKYKIPYKEQANYLIGGSIFGLLLVTAFSTKRDLETMHKINGKSSPG